MSQGRFINGIAAGRLDSEQIQQNFADLHPPLSAHEASVEADRCYFCYDAPCLNACPTEIDIPLFIRQISTGDPLGSAKTIFDQNILGGMCARVCPTETLCEQACVREAAEGKPVKIGLLQRYATDAAMANDARFYERGAATGKRVAVIGAGPAGLACAHRLALYGHEVQIFEAREKPGGLNEYGIAAYKTVDDFANQEVDYILSIGGISIEYGRRLGEDLALEDLLDAHDAVFVGVGMSDVNTLDLADSNSEGVDDAVDFIADLRQAQDLTQLPLGRKIVVIGGGMTAIDVAVQAKLLGAEEVTICYRRGKENMNASAYEQDLATSKGVSIRHWLQPVKLETDSSKIVGIQLEYTHQANGALAGTGEYLSLPADQVFTAIGQKVRTAELSQTLELASGRIKVDEHGRTSNPKVWAGGDCVAGGEDLTVSAVAMGRDAAENIHRALG